MKIFCLPDLGEGLQEAEIREWYIKEGDDVQIDQPLVAMETAKAVVDVPSVYDGKIKKLGGQVGEIIQTGAMLVEFESSEDRGTVVGHLESEPTSIKEEKVTSKSIQPSSSSVIKAVPVVRILAKKLNINLTTVTPTGNQGQITEEDVKRAAAIQSHTILSDYEPLRGVRRAMCITMTNAHAEVVPVTLMDEIDINSWSGSTDITLRLIRAMIAACRKEPALNAWFDSKNTARYLHQEINLGLAIDSPEGLFTPVLRKVNETRPEDWRMAIDDFKKIAKARTFSPDQLKGATITLSNVGIFAGRYANPIIVPPTVAILAVGRIYKKVVLDGEKLTEHRLLPLSLTVDHRVVTGGEAARFLNVLMKDLAEA